MKHRKLAISILTVALCVSFAVPGLARHHHHYHYDNGSGGTFRTRTWYPDQFAAYLGITGAGSIPVFDALAFVKNSAIVTELIHFTEQIQSLFGFKEERIASTLDIEIEKLRTATMPETAPDNESRQDGVILSGKTVIDPKVNPEDTVLGLQVDHFDAHSIATDINYGVSLHRTLAMEDYLAVNREQVSAMDDMNEHLQIVNSVQSDGLAGVQQQGIAMQQLRSGITQSGMYQKFADLGLDIVGYETDRILKDTADRGLSGTFRGRVIDPFHKTAEEQKMLNENADMVKSKNIGWRKF